MQYRMIHCTNCNQIIGRYQIFSHAFDEIDTGDAEFNEEYGGTFEAEDYCVNCFPEHSVCIENDEESGEEIRFVLENAHKGCVDQ